LTLPKWKEGFALDCEALFAFVVVMAVVVVMIVVVVVDGEIGSEVWSGVVRVGLVSEEGRLSSVTTPKSEYVSLARYQCIPELSINTRIAGLCLETRLQRLP
jgi:hypothetical protein